MYNDIPSEPNVDCVQCGALRPIGDMLFDEHAEIYLCDRECFDAWHYANNVRVGDFYYDLNIGY